MTESDFAAQQAAIEAANRHAEETRKNAENIVRISEDHARSLNDPTPGNIIR